MAFELLPLPYDKSALEPHMSLEVIRRETVMGQFGSDWAWLVADKGRAEDRQGANAMTRSSRDKYRSSPATSGSMLTPSTIRTGAPISSTLSSAN